VKASLFTFLEDNLQNNNDIISRSLKEERVGAASSLVESGRESKVTLLI
jgi:hypothetical protein